MTTINLTEQSEQSGTENAGTYRPIDARTHPWTVKEFETDRKEQADCGTRIVNALEKNTNVLVSAPVKSGKRQIAEYVALTYAAPDKPCTHYFITALNRRDAKVQLAELERYPRPDEGMKTVILVGKQLKDLLHKLGSASNTNNIIVHFDESDYGTGIKNMFAQVFGVCKRRSIKLICYSATNEEAESSGFAEKAEHVAMVPNKLYKGAKWFLDNDLVHEPQAFYDSKAKAITPHGWEVIDWWLTQPNKPMAILRLTGGDKDKGLYSLFENSPGLGTLARKNIICKFVDGHRDFDWMNGHESPLQIYEKDGVRTLIVINQTCTRSTELGFHEHVAFLHDHRPNESHYSTLAQAYLRVAHYHSVGYKVRVYGEKAVFQLHAGEIQKEEYNGKLSQRMIKNTTKAGLKLADAEIHWYKPVDDITDPAILTDAEKLKEKIQSIWNQHITNAKTPGAFASGKVYQGFDKAKPKFKRSKTNPNILKEITGKGLDSTTTTKRHCFIYQNVDADKSAMGGGVGAKSTTTKKRHGFKNVDGPEYKVIVYSLFHDGTMENVVEDNTVHTTTNKSAFQAGC
jgi:hypothetical protein